MMNRHHIVPRSRGGSNYDVNIMMIEDTKHVNHHRVFKNDTPVEQLRRMLNFNSKALTFEFIKEIEHVLDGGDDWIYENGVFKNKHYAM